MKLTDKISYSLLALISFILQIPHSMAPWGNGNYPTDICIYARIAGWMNQGLVLYQDMFDHKGPLVFPVYIVYWLTSSATPYGVWLLDIFILFLSLCLIYRMAKLYVANNHALLIASLMACFIQLPFVDEGGSDWLVMPGCIYSCYLLAKRLKDEQYCSLKEIFLFSASVAICMMIKPNTSACMIPIAGFILWHLIRHYDPRVFGRYALGVVLGVGIILVPIAIWLVQQDNINGFIESYWRFNTGSYGPISAHRRLMGIVTITLVCLPAYFTYVVYAIFANKRTWPFWLVTILFFFTVALNAYLKNGYPHYVLPTIGVFALVLVLAWQHIRSRKALLVVTSALYLLVGLGAFSARAYNSLTPFDTSVDEQTARYINSQTEADDYVMVCDVEDRSRWNMMDPSYSFVFRLWLLLDAKPASPYFFLPPSITPQMSAHSWELITQRMPKFVVCTDDHKADYIGIGYTEDKDLHNDFYILRRP